MEKARRQFAQLNKELNALLDEWEKTPEEQLLKKTEDGGWSNLQAGWHLIKSERQTLEYMRKKMLGGSVLTQAGLKAKLRHFVLATALRLPVKWRAPVSSIHPPEEVNYESTVNEWKKTRAQWEEFLASFPENMANAEIFRHPLAGRLNLYQTLDFFQQHFRHHLRQLRRRKS